MNPRAPGPTPPSGRLTPGGSGRLGQPIGAGTRLGGYVLESLLGQGGMGQVWRARDEALGRVVAVKVLPISVRDDRRARSLRELEAASRVKHPNIVDVHAAGEGPGCLYLAMDLVEGTTLDAVLGRGPLEPRRAATLALGLSRALAALHAAGVLHRDVKPSNVLLGGDDVPRLMDFGIARLRDAETLTKTQQVLGTPVYMAPEQMNGEAVDERADVYGLGAVLYECLTGRPPAEGDTLMALAAAKESPITPPSARAREHLQATPAIDPALDAVTLQALAPLAGRYASAQALADELERWLAGAPVLALPRRSLLPVALALVAVLLLVGAGVVALALRGGAGAEPLGPLVARQRMALEAQAGSAAALIELDVEPARELVLRAQAEPGVEALARWVALVDLARSGAAPPLPAATERGPAAQALRGALLRETDPGAALAALEQAQRGGLDPVEVRRWRLEALAARGVETKAEAAARLAELDRLAALDAALAARLEVGCLVALGRLREARQALSRAGSAPVEAWALGVAEARELVAQGQLARAWKVLEPTPRPAGPVRPAEADLAARALEAGRSQIEALARASSALRLTDDVERLVGALSLHTRALPAPAPPAELRDPALQVVVQTVAFSSEPELILALADLYPDDAALQAGLAMWFAIGAEEPGTSGRVVALARRNLARCRPQDAPIHGLALARHLFAAGRLDEGAEVLDRLDPSAAGEDERELAAELAILLRCMLLRARAQPAAALALLDEADRRELKEVSAKERLAHRLSTLVAAGRRDEALTLVLRTMAERPATNGHVRVAITGAAWDLCLEAGRLAELRAFAESLVQEFDLDGLWQVRLGWLRATLGDPAGAAEAYERSGQHRLSGGAALTARLRAGEPEAVQTLLTMADLHGVASREHAWRSALDLRGSAPR